MPNTLATLAPVREGRTLALSGDAGDFLAMQATSGAPDGYAPIMVFRTSVMSGGGVALDYVCEHTGPWESVADTLRAYASTGTGPAPTPVCAGDCAAVCRCAWSTRYLD